MTLAGNRRFELRRELGRGGMGVVYEAFDTERQQPVALKMLHGNDPETIVQLKQEFRSLSEIVHPHLISMYELLGDEQSWFFTMELIRNGTNFLDRLRGPSDSHRNDSHSERSPASFRQPSSDAATVPGQPLSRNRVPLTAPSSGGSADLTQATLTSTSLHIPEAGLTRGPVPTRPRKPPLAPEQLRTLMDGFRQLALGVSGLHAQGKLHRDLKPGNVMVRADGSVVILDFGLAIAKKRPADPDASASPDWSVSGTIPYMAPEQAMGLPLTEASDWYAVGTMLFEALTGEWPFEGLPFDILHAKQSRDAPDVNALAEDLPPDLASLCNALLRRDPALRPSEQEILEALGGEETADLPRELDPDRVVFIGREEYLQRLEAAFTRSRSAPVVAHLRARSGTGKSALMSEFIRRLGQERRALVFRSRCYEQESVPYKTVDGLADEIAVWMARLPGAELSALIPSAALALAQIFPVFRQAPGFTAMAGNEPSSDLEELRRQAFEAFGEMLERIGQNHPLVLCIDDLQWGDGEGVEMLGVALRRPALRLLLLATFREEYADTSACLRTLLALEPEIPALAVEDIAVQPLNREESLELVRRRNPDTAAGDLEEIVRQAEGNPYFLEELAHHSGAERSVSSAAGLQLDAILWGRIERLSAPELRLLETVAVSGQPIRLRYAQDAAGLRDVPLSVLTSLRMHHLVRSSGSGLQDEVETYHDRIRETVLDHLPREQRRDHHARLAFCLEASGEATSDTLAVHFEAGDQAQKAGHFYELAAQESASALAFTRAEEFYKKARRLLSDSAARTRITERLIHLNTDLARFPEAYRLGREALAELGMKIPAKFLPPAFAADLAQFWYLFRGRRADSIVDLPAATDARHIARITLLAAIGKAAYQMRPELCIAIMLKIVNASVRRGNTRDSAIGYMAVGAIFVGGILGRYRRGYEFGQAALRLVDRYEATRIRAEVNFVVGYFGISWQRPAEEAEELWKVAHRAGLESGDLFHMGCASCATVMSQFMRGVPLDKLERLCGEYLELLSRYGLREPRSAILAVGRTMHALRDPASADPSLQAVEAEPEFGSRHIAHYALLVELQQHVLFGEYAAALETGARSAQYRTDSRGMLHGTEHDFWLSLAELALLRDQPQAATSGASRRARRALKKFEHWAAGSPANFRARALLLRGAVSSASRRSDSALAAFAEAAETAASFNQPHMAALAKRLAAAEHGRAGQQERERELLAEAVGLYRHWGAGGFAARLQEISELSTRSVS